MPRRHTCVLHALPLVQQQQILGRYIDSKYRHALETLRSRPERISSDTAWAQRENGYPCDRYIDRLDREDE